MISQTTEYALRAIVYLADQSGKLCTTVQIAAGTVIPVRYLAKVMHALVREGIVHSQRGPQGGFQLTKDPKELSVLQVINAIDPIQRYEKCPLNIPNHNPDLCPLHRAMDDAGKTLEQLLGNKTIAKLLEVPNRRKPLCQFPCLPDSILLPE